MLVVVGVVGIVAPGEQVAPVHKELSLELYPVGNGEPLETFNECHLCGLERIVFFDSCGG